MRAFTLAIISAFSPGVSASFPHDPIPPGVNTYGYHFGALDDGSSTSNEGGRPADESSHLGAEENDIGPHDCRTLSDNVQVCTPSSKGRGKSRKLSPAELALTKWTRLPVPVPVVRTAPPRWSDGLVGLPEWFWVTNWRSVSGRAAARGVWAEVTARPQSTTIDPGYGHRVVRCSGAGTAFDESMPVSSQRTDCSYTFSQSSVHERGAAYRVRVTVTWGGTWRGSDGSGGMLPPLSRSTSLRMRVAEAQGLYVRGTS